MDLRFKFGNTIIKIGKDGKVEYSENRNIPAKAPFMEFNLDFLYAAYQMFPSNVISYLNSINKAINKPIRNEGEALTYESIEGKPGIIPATGNDIYNYVARYGMANFQIQAVMKLNGRLSRKRLLEAVRLSIEAEPVFGCSFVENELPYWRPLDEIDKITFCTFEETNDPDEAVKRFLESPLDMDKDPMVKLRLIRSGPNDTLCLKINHTCCDGTGTKEYMQLLSNIYSCIDEKNKGFVVKPSIQSRKDQDRLFNALGIIDPEAVRNPLQDVPKTVWPFPWRPGKPGIARVAACKLPKGYVDVMSQYAKARGATISDLILTALYRAMFEISHPVQGVPMDISMTVDLRRYLPNQKTEAIRNFSGGFNTRIARVKNETFEGTLLRVVPMMNKIRSGRPGLQSAVGLYHVENGDLHQSLSFYRSVSQFAKQIAGYIPQCVPVLSNLGVIDKSLFKFGETAVTDAYIVPPALCAPGILLCVGTYNEEITISVSYYESQVRREHMENLLNQIKKELMEGCRS